MIDIHSHILPGVDDGTKTLEESLEILKVAAYAGVKTIVATPHILEFPSESNWQRIKGIFYDVKKNLRSQKIDIQIILGAELLISPELPMKIKQNKEVTINNGNRYILLELPMQEIPAFTEETIFKLLLQNIVPIIAHPERYIEIQKDPSKLFDMIKKGALAQINSGSLTGRYGRKVQKTSKTLLARSLIHMIGSDIHSISNGPYTLQQGINIASDIIGKERVKAITTSIPEKIISGEMIEVMLSSSPQRRAFRNLFRKNKAVHKLFFPIFRKS